MTDTTLLDLPYFFRLFLAKVLTLKAFQKYYEEYKVLPRGNFNSAFNFGHLNPYGHRAVADVLTEALEEILK